MYDSKISFRVVGWHMRKIMSMGTLLTVNENEGCKIALFFVVIQVNIYMIDRYNSHI